MYWMNKDRQACLIPVDDHNRKTNYCTLAGLSFEDKTPVPESWFNWLSPVQDKQPVAPVQDELSVLQEEYEAVTWSMPPARYKNDVERLKKKINETVTK